MKRIAYFLIGLMLASSLSSCGTILYPERKGQISGRLDVGVVLLDAAGLLLWLVPGVIAFAVDFSNGTIYLPGGERAELTSEELEHLTLHDGRAVDKQVFNSWAHEKLSLAGEATLPEAEFALLGSSQALPAGLRPEG